MFENKILSYFIFGVVLAFSFLNKFYLFINLFNEIWLHLFVLVNMFQLKFQPCAKTAGNNNDTTRERCYRQII